jgi:hypothetical protein
MISIIFDVAVALQYAPRSHYSNVGPLVPTLLVLDVTESAALGSKAVLLAEHRSSPVGRLGRVGVSIRKFLRRHFCRQFLALRLRHHPLVSFP